METNHRVDDLLKRAAQEAKKPQRERKKPYTESTRETRARRARQEQDAQMRESEHLRMVDLALREPAEAARQAGRICPHCHEPMLPKVVPTPLPWDEKYKLVLFPDSCGCPGEVAAQKQQAEQVQVVATKQAAQSRLDTLDKAGLTGQLMDATFDSFGPRDDWPGAERAKETAIEYSKTMLSGGLDTKPFLVLCGDYGTGKTHLAAAIAHRALGAGWGGVFLRSWSAYLKRIQATWDKKDSDTPWETEADVLRELSKGRLVILDDIDKKPPSAWSREMLYTPINTRLIENAPTILTFNCTLDTPDPNAPARLALEDVLGAAVLDRIIGAAWAVVLFNGPSYRSGVRWSGNRR